MKNAPKNFLLLFLLLVGCEKEINKFIEPANSGTEPEVVNSKNYYSISIEAQNSSFSRVDTLHFESDSLVVVETMRDYIRGTAHFRVLGSDSSTIYHRFFFGDVALCKSSVVGRTPALIIIQLEDITGFIDFKIVAWTDTLSFDTTGTKKASDAIYFNSFESLEDINGWDGYGTFTLYEEAPPGGGRRSLYVSGGCIWPHATFSLPPLKEDGFLILQCWGKYGGGSVRLISGTSSLRKRIWISIADPGWRFYRSSNSLYCPADSSLTIELSSGGFSPNSMLIDLLQIRKVKSTTE